MTLKSVGTSSSISSERKSATRLSVTGGIAHEHLRANLASLKRRSYAERFFETPSGLSASHDDADAVEEECAALMEVMVVKQEEGESEAIARRRNASASSAVVVVTTAILIIIGVRVLCRVVVSADVSSCCYAVMMYGAECCEASTLNFLGAGRPNGGLDSIKSMSSAAKLLQCKTRLQTTTLLNMLSFTAHLSPFSLSLDLFPNNKVQKNVAVAS